jgi:hypothetical protein
LVPPVPLWRDPFLQPLFWCMLRTPQTSFSHRTLPLPLLIHILITLKPESQAAHLSLYNT